MVAFSPFVTFAGALRVNNQAMPVIRDSRSAPFAAACPRYVSLCKPQRVGGTWYLRSGEYVRAADAAPAQAFAPHARMVLPKPR